MHYLTVIPCVVMVQSGKGINQMASSMKSGPI